MISILSISAILTAAACLHGADYVKLDQEAAKAVRAKDHALAEVKFGEAVKAARNPAEKCKAVRGKFDAMRKQKKRKEAETFMTEAIADESLRPQDVRLLLNVFGVSFLGAARYEYGLAVLRYARNLPCPKTDNAYYVTYDYMAHFHLRRKQPEAVIEIMDNVLQVKGIHPANLCSGNLLVGRDYEQLRMKDEALKHCRAAMKHGKQVKYKFYAEKSQKLRQVIVNDRSAWSSLTWEKKLPRREQLKGLKTAVRRTPDGWAADIAIPVSALQTDRSGLRFNCMRERSLKGKKTEFSTWSPLAMLGNWQGVNNCGTLVFLPAEK